MSDRGGSNTLRGGKNQYNAKTLNDNWVEDRYAPQFEGVRPNNATTAHRQDLEGGLRFRVDALCRFAMCCAATDHSPCSMRPAATKTTTMRYGGQLQHSAKFDDTIDYGNTIGYDKSAAPASWKSVTQSVHAPPAVAKPTEFSTSFKLGTNEFTDAAKADEYRSKW